MVLVRLEEWTLAMLEIVGLIRLVGSETAGAVSRGCALLLRSKAM